MSVFSNLYHLQRFSDSKFFYPLVLLAVGLISYLLFLPEPGFYWDDWQAVYLFQTGDPALIGEYFQFDRPFSAWTYQVTFPIFGISSRVWQWFTLLTRMAGILLLVAALQRIWPGRVKQLRWFGGLLLVYPGFLMQPIALAFSQHFLTLLFFTGSLYLMVRGVQARKRWLGWMTGASLAALVHIFTMEYFLGLELLRAVVLWLAVRRESFNRIKTTKRMLGFALPILIIFSLFLYWRLVLYPLQFETSPPNEPELLMELVRNPLPGMLDFTNLALQDCVFLLLGSWMRLVDPDSINLFARATLASWVIGLLTAYGFGRAIHTAPNEMTQSEPADHFYLQGLVVGMVGILGGLPVWMLGRQILEGRWSDRFALAPMVGATLMTVLAVDWLLRTRAQKNGLFILLMGLSIALQMRTANKYNLEWAEQREFFWQLYWRAPVVASNTAFFSANIPGTTLSGYSTAFALNVLYSTSDMQNQSPYWFFTPGDLGGAFKKLEPEYEIHNLFRNIRFDGNTSQALALMYKPASGCLKVLDEAYRGDPAARSADAGLIKLTNQAVIREIEQLPGPAQTIFGREPQHEWCYYFQKTDLARAAGDWDAVLAGMAEAEAAGVSPRTGVEYAPLLEAQFYLQDWQGFEETSQKALVVTADAGEFICRQIQRLEKQTSRELPQPYRTTISAAADCR